VCRFPLVGCRVGSRGTGMVRFVARGFRPTRLGGDRCGGRSSGLGRSGRLVPHEHSLTSELSRFGRAKLAAGWTLRRKGLGTSNFFETGAFLRSAMTSASPTCSSSSCRSLGDSRKGRSSPHLVSQPSARVILELDREDAGRLREPESLQPLTEQLQRLVPERCRRHRSRQGGETW
jgi:hypothetical protein